MLYAFAAGVITASGYYMPFKLVSKGAGGAQYTLLVPPSLTGQLLVDTRLTATDSQGVIPNRVPSRPLAMNGEERLTVDLTVE